MEPAQPTYTHAIVVDWDKTLNADNRLIETLAAFKENGMRIVVCSTNFKPKDIEYLKERGLVLNYEEDFVQDNLEHGKGHKVFWQEMPEKLGVQPEYLLAIDDDQFIYETVTRAKLRGVKWNFSSLTRIEELKQTVQAMGFEMP